jgi:hypothetical protein
MATTPQSIEPELQQAPGDAGAEQQPDQQEESQQQDFGPWNERLPEELQQVLIKLARHFCDEFRYARRLEVMQAWRARSFWREMQHLTWNWDGECWDVLGPAGVGPNNSSPGVDKQSAVLYSTNLYQGFGESFIAIITQSVPNLRFEPTDTEEAADIETARVADDFRKYIQHENDPIELMTKAAYYAWTDGRMHGFTRWEVDKRTKQPREMQSIEGVMEVKVPVIYGKQCDYTYIQYSTEYHLSAVRAKVRSREFEPDYYKKIKGGSTGNGQDVYERTARISVKQGISLLSAGGDMYSHLCTTQRTWMRPHAFLEDCVDSKWVDQLESLFPDGCLVEVDNGVYTGSKNANMDDEWAVENVMEGDGSNRNAKGTCLVSVQERFNDTANTTQDTFEKAQPAGHMDEEIFDLDALTEQVSAPGERHPVDMSSLPPGDTLSNHVFMEPAAAVDSSQLAYLKELGTDIPESLTGISAILFGGGSGDESGKALSIKQAAAMGRIGLPFRIMKRLYARMMEQAVRCAAQNRKDDISIGIPDEQGRIEPIAVRVGDLDGNVRCFPDSDENYPESWTSKRQTYTTLMQDQDPTMKAILSSPHNQVVGKKLIGLQDIELPDADSWNKQMAEINLMLQVPPTPPQPPPQPSMQVPNPLAPHIMETVPAPPTPPQSTVPVDVDWDNHAAELVTVQTFLNSPKGQQLAKTNQPGIENIKLHGMAHKQALQQQQMQQMQQQMAAMPPQGPSKPKQPTPEAKESAGAQNPAHHAPVAAPPAPASGL